MRTRVHARVLGVVWNGVRVAAGSLRACESILESSLLVNLDIPGTATIENCGIPD